jgi:hypothetical protein
MSESEQIEPVSAQQPGESFGEWLLRLTPAQRKKLDEYLEYESYSNFVDQQVTLRAWEEEQRAKAPEILALLRRHVPGERWQEVEEFLSGGYGRDCLGEAIRRDRERAALRRHLSAEHWQEIEDYLATGIAKGRVAEVLEALE